MNKSEKVASKTIKEIKEISSNPIPDKTTAAEVIKRRTSK